MQLVGNSNQSIDLLHKNKQSITSFNHSMNSITFTIAYIYYFSIPLTSHKFTISIDFTSPKMDSWPSMLPVVSPLVSQPSTSHLAGRHRKASPRSRFRRAPWRLLGRPSRRPRQPRAGDVERHWPRRTAGCGSWRIGIYAAKLGIW